MFLSRLWKALKAQLNKVANFFWQSDPIALLQYEYDAAIDQLKEGRVGIEQYRALVERISRQVAKNRQYEKLLEAKVKIYLQEGDRETAGRLALELQEARRELRENEAQLKLHEEVYGNHLTKIKHASAKLAELKRKIIKYDAELRMSRAEAEVAKIAQSIHVDITTDFGQIEEAVQEEIDRNRAKVRVATDLSSEGLDKIRHEMATEKQLAEDALREFETEMAREQEPRREKQLQ